jgi:hypothetical protein
MRYVRVLIVAALLVTGFGSRQATAQDAGSLAEIQDKLLAEYTITGTTADRSDIVTPGAVLVLHKNTLLMYSTTAITAPMNTYKDGMIQQSAAGNYLRGFGKLMLVGGDSSNLQNIPSRKFVAGEKFWVTDISVSQDGVTFTAFSDPYGDLRYYGKLKFPFPKKTIPPTAQVIRTVEEVLSVAGAAGNDASQQAQGGSSAALPQLAPPPPPADQPPAPPKTIKVGQTKAVVIATWGEPSKDIKLAAKEILVYPDMKVTFVSGKVSNVQ